ncbi:peptidoglycan hydrolase [Bacillus sp. MUM 116]|uniref:glycosyl hydrolase family 18 protein n=1 Tax=Bacillus sp. MUM 116 TaxID=1678002 RepID=UPI0008F59EE8|nr:glycosyl hydrolase family 18 protein [Bacillus sp. MUM 116]OIK13236.1 peptidoglycan hydrolase [Bacillus sp. MUM 116]
MARIEYYKNQKISSKWLIGGIIIALLMIVSSILFILYPFASNEKSSYFHGKYPILINKHQQGNALVEGTTIYIPLSFLQENIDKSIVFDEKSHSIIITTSDKVIQMPTDSLTYFINQKPVKLHIPPIKTEDGNIFVALEPILSLYPIQYQKLAGSGVIWIQKNGDQFVKGQLTSDDIHMEKLRLRTKPSLLAPYTAQMTKKDTVWIEGEKDGYYLVRNQAGISGYIKKEYVHKQETITINVVRESKPIHHKKVSGPVQLTWEAVYTKNPDPSKIPEMAGVNVVSPTWFSLEGKDGSIKNLASLGYSKWAKSKGYQVWGLFSNGFDPQLTHDALKEYETRQKIIRQLLLFGKMYRLQGINFDIENVNSKDGTLVTQFMREASPYLHKAGLTISIDITFSAGDNNNWSSFYERKELSELADYLIVMAYDEHWGPASGAGSVASLPWVEKNLQTLLTEVPNERLILGIPLYARLWKIDTKNDGTENITAKNLTMDHVKVWLKDKKLKPKYDEVSGQNYAEYYNAKDKTRYKIWIEDELSLKKRAELAAKYELAGVASWSRFFADQNAWVALDLKLNKSITRK